MRNGKQLKR